MRPRRQSSAKQVATSWRRSEARRAQPAPRYWRGHMHDKERRQERLGDVAAAPASRARHEPLLTHYRPPVDISERSQDPTIQFGSGVVIAPDRVATACHVTRGAVTIEIERGGNRWSSQRQFGSALHDLCVLDVPTGELPIARIRGSQELRSGERVLAAGFQGGGEHLVIERGSIAALYPYDDGLVIRTTAVFDFGSSGGGLFDEAGNLVGLLAFKARSGKNLRFALPSEWMSPTSVVSSDFSRIEPTSMTRTFWERAQGDRPSFLGVALREAESQRD